MEKFSEESESYLKNLLSDRGSEPVDADTDFIELQLPPWYDPELFKRAQYFSKKYVSNVFTSMLVGLVAILSIPSILEVLIHTGRSGTPADAYRRYVETIHHILAWKDFDLKPGTSAWKSIEKVRKAHLSSRKMCEKTAKITITQRDMALTQFGFLGFNCLYSAYVEPGDLEEFHRSIFHFWRVIGYLLGIKDEFNLCTESDSISMDRLKIVLDRIFRPNLEKPNRKFEKMMYAFIDGMHHFETLITQRTVLFTVKRLAKCKGYEILKSDFQTPPTEEYIKNMEYYKLNWFLRLELFSLTYFFSCVTSITFIRWILNFRFYMCIFFSRYFPFMALWSFGAKKSYVKIF